MKTAGAAPIFPRTASRRMLAARRTRKAFTLMELLVVIVIIGVLAVIALPVYSMVFRKSHQTAALANMRQVGAAFLLYAGDHNYTIPNRTKGNDDQGNPKPRWPHILQPYVQDLRVYGAPLDDTDGKSYRVANVNDYISDTANNTAFIGNGYNDLGAYDDPDVEIRINRIDSPSRVLMLGTPKPKLNNFYMDFQEKNNKEVLNLTAFGNGSNYFFTDGSSQFLKAPSVRDLAVMQKEPATSDLYTDWLWLVDKSQAATTIQ